MYEYQKPTDSAHKIELPSSIDRAFWDRGVASIGEQVEFLVYTHFVGDGSKTKITFKNRNGRKIDEITAQVYGNRCRGRWTVSDRARNAVYYEVELKEHGIRAESEELIIVPARSITNARWSQPDARRGDILTLSADTENFPDGTEARIVIYEYDEDGAHDLITELRGIVENNRIEVEWEYEYYEDTDEIPNDQEAESGYSYPEYIFKVIIGRIEAQSDLLRFKDWIDFIMRDGTDTPVTNQEYILHLPDGQERRGRIGSDGRVIEKDIPPGPWWIEILDNTEGSS
ncbi:MAG: hypothetical protein ACPL7B_17670 [Candidatus Poribacteria bacterium]